MNVKDDKGKEIREWIEENCTLSESGWGIGDRNLCYIRNNPEAITMQYFYLKPKFNEKVFIMRKRQFT
jgi:hypothetical protein